MSTGARHEQGGSDPYEWLRNVSPDYARKVEAVTRMGLRLHPQSPEAPDVAHATIDALREHRDAGRIWTIDSAQPELAVVYGVFEFIRWYHQLMPMKYPYPGHEEYSLPTAAQCTTYTYERGMYVSTHPYFSRYELQTVTRSREAPGQKPLRGRVDILLARGVDDGLWYPRPLAEQAHFTDQEIRRERVYIEAHGTLDERVELN